MKKQYAVFGLGSFGESVAIELQKLGCEVVAIDANMERVEAIANQVSYAMKADIEDADFIRSLGTRNLDGVVVAASDNMEASIMATLVCKEIGVPYVMAKAKNELHATVLKKIGADSVIFPEKEMGMRVARNLMSANFTDWIALSPDYSLVETEVPEKWVGRTLLELDVRKTYDVIVVGIKMGDKVEVNPDPKELLKEGNVLILIGSNKLLYRLNGKCMYRYGLEVVAALWQKGLLDTIVIVTQYEEIIYDMEAHFPYMKTVNNPHPEAGISGSIRLGVEKLIELEEKCGKTGSRKREGCMFAVADQPYLTRESLENMVETWEVSKKGILVSENAGRMGNPVIFAYKYYEELKKLEGDVGGKCVLKKHLDDVQMFEMPASELKDLDSLTEIHE